MQRFRLDPGRIRQPGSGFLIPFLREEMGFWFWWVFSARFKLVGFVEGERWRRELDAFWDISDYG